jgi:hypothetical protein
MIVGRAQVAATRRLPLSDEAEAISACPIVSRSARWANGIWIAATPSDREGKTPSGDLYDDDDDGRDWPI